MTMKCLLRVLLAVVCATALSLGAAAPTSAKPDFVFILANDLGVRSGVQEHVATRQAQRDNDWNRITIEARGPVVKTWLNGVPIEHWRMEEYLSGCFGLQLHKGQQGRILWRNLKIKTL